MTTLHSYKDDNTYCFGNARMDNGDPCYVSVAQKGVVVKKSKLGLLGAKLYSEDNVYAAAQTAQSLDSLYPDDVTPNDITNPVLKAFMNAILQCSHLAEVTRVLNEAIKNAKELD
jgi:hypothetical protein